MTSKGIWEVDPETRSKLHSIQQQAGNNVCCDCGAPSPQWASPKFGIFICLSCAGIHRSLGVHISFVRSISMDSFKAGEIERMRLGGNTSWRKFWEGHKSTQDRGLTWDDVTIAERYSDAVGEEWKERLSAQVEGREFDEAGFKKRQDAVAAGDAKPGKGGASLGLGPNSTGTGASRSASPTTRSAGVDSGGKAKVDEQYFGRLAAENAARRDDLPPSQGGKYAGFGNTPAPPTTRRQDGGAGGPPGLQELQADPLAALSKGFGWFANTVTRTAQTVNHEYIQPTAKQIAESELATQARSTAGTVAGNVGKIAQQGAKTAHEGFTRFVEGPSHTTGGGARVGGAAKQMDESKRAFWDDFSSKAGSGRSAGSSSIGTAAIGGSRAAAGGVGGTGGAAFGSKKEG